MSVIKAICKKVAVMEQGRVVEVGEVYAIFADPKEEITKKFISSQSSLSKFNKIAEGAKAGGKNLIKLQFRKEAVGDSLISTVSRKFNVDLNIVLANVDMIQKNPLGEIIVEIKGQDENVRQSLAYVKEQGVFVFNYNEKNADWEVA